MKRILVVRRTYGFGGVEVILLDWLKRIDYSRYEVLVTSPTDVFSKAIAENKLPATFVHLSAEQSRHIYGRYQPEKGIMDLVKQSFWRVFPIWFRFLRGLRPDIVIFMDGDFFSIPLACVLAAFVITQGNVSSTIHSPYRLQEPPQSREMIYHHGIPDFWLRWRLRVWWPLLAWKMRKMFVRRVLTATRMIRERVVRFYGYPDSMMGLVSHGVDTDKFRPCEATRLQYRQQLGIPEDAFVIASTSRLSQEKGIDRLVAAFEKFASANPKAWLLMTGIGPLKPQVEKLIRSCAVDSRVKLLGHVEDVRPVLQAADVYVLASTFEGCPIALMEAMAVGLVCLMSRIPGPDEVLIDGRDGFLIGVSEQGILTALEQALALTRAEREEMGRLARQKIIDHYELDKAVHCAFQQLGIEPLQSADSYGVTSEICRNSANVGESSVRL